MQRAFDGERHRRAAMRAVEWGCIAIIAAAIAGAFVGLGASSLWADELFTAYFADPSIGDLGGLIIRAAEDVHPPGYYILVWGAARISGADLTVVSRALSAAFAGLTIVPLYLAPPRPVGRFGRLVACAFAVGSTFWFYYAQEARSYALVFGLATLLMLLAFRIRAAFAGVGRAKGLLCAFGVVGAAGGLVHFYMVPLVGGMVTMLVLLARHWHQRAAIAMTGLALLVPVLAFMAWHSGKAVVDVSDTWFERTPQFISGQIFQGVVGLLGSPAGILLAALIMFPAIPLSLLKDAQGRRFRFGPMAPDYVLLIGSGVVGVGMTAAVTMLLVPSFSYRFFVVLAPLFWVLIGFLSDALARVVPPRLAWPAAVVLLALLALQASKVAWRDIPKKQPWREAAAAVAQIPECADAPLPVVWLDQQYISGSVGAHFYGYYLPDGANRQWLLLPDAQIWDAMKTPPIPEVLAARIAGTDPCPILVWAMHSARPETMDTLRRFINSRTPPPEGSRIVLRRFVTPAPGLLRRLSGDNHGGVGYLVIVERR